MDSIAKFFEEGGMFMYVNLVVSISALAVIFERIYYLFFRISLNAPVFMDQIQKLLRAGRIDNAIRLCLAAKNAPLAKVVKTGLERLGRKDEEIVASVEEQLMSVLPSIGKRIPALWSIANISTLIGLIGTIIGLIRSFASLAFATPEQRATLLSKGISEAMNNTAFGLSIAVACIIAHLFLSASAKKMTSDLESNAFKLENMLIFQKETEAPAGSSTTGQVKGS
jgi:biopolymer transport protein ExbB/TolQ